VTPPPHDRRVFEEHGDMIDDVLRRLLVVGIAVIGIAVAVIAVAWLLSRH
jgi:hypothetical protein